jgi:hypothetical protein
MAAGIGGAAVGLVSTAALDQQVLSRFEKKGSLPEALAEGTIGRSALLAVLALGQGAAANALMGKTPAGAAAAGGLAAGGIVYAFAPMLRNLLAPKGAEVEGGGDGAEPPSHEEMMGWRRQQALGALYESQRLPLPQGGWREQQYGNGGYNYLFEEEDIGALYEQYGQQYQAARDAGLY